MRRRAIAEALNKAQGEANGATKEREEQQANRPEQTETVLKPKRVYRKRAQPETGVL